MVGICWIFSHLTLLLRVQLEHTFPFLAHTHVLQRPLPLHRQHCDMYDGSRKDQFTLTYFNTAYSVCVK